MPLFARGGASTLVPVLALLLVVAGSAGVRAADSPGPGDADPGLYDPVLAGERDEVFDETAGQLARYRIEASLIPDDPARIAGTVDLLYLNDTGEELDKIYLRLYANDALYGDGGITIDDVEVADVPVAPVLGVADTVAELPLSTALPVGETVSVSYAFTATPPMNAGHGYGMYGVDTGSGTWALAHWYPVLAGRDAGGAWNLQPPSENGDPIFSNTALYEVTLTAPAELVLVTTGSVVETTVAGDGRTSHRIVTGPVRDFTIVADDDFDVVSREVDGTVVNSWYNPGRETGAELALDYGAESLAMFNDLFGAYPYEEFDIVDVGVGGGAAGIEFPQLVFIGDAYYDNPGIEQAMPGFFEFLVVHEVAHQWWYGLVGNDQYVDAFIDEGLTNYVSTIYFERRYGEEEGAFQVTLNLELPYLGFLFEEGDQIVDQPTDDFVTMGDYGVTIYAKGALGFQAVREAIGDEAFFAGLRQYVEGFRFAVATPADLRSAFEAASGQDLSELWRHWFEAAEGTQDYTPEDLNEAFRELDR
jgi:hypothetical protein